MPAATKQEIAILRKDILDMRLAGWSTIEIAQELDLTVRTINSHISQAVKDMDATRYLESEVQISLNQLDTMWQWSMPMARYGDDGKPDRSWTETLLKIQESKRKLLGLDAPKKVDVTLGVRQWAEDNGFDPDDVAMVAPALLAQFAGR